MDFAPVFSTMARRLHHVLIEGLPVMVGLEQRRAHGLQQSLLPDVGIRIVDENAWIHIAVCVDVHIAAAPGDAAAHELRIVLEVHSEQRLAGAVITDSAINLLPLLRRRQELGTGVITDGHVVEIPDEIGTLLDEHVVIFFRSNGIPVDAGIAGGNAVQ